MTNEEMERAIEFLLEHHAKFSADIEQLKEVQRQQAESINRQVENINRLAVTVSDVQGQVKSIVTEMRDGFNSLIVANEVTRKLVEDVARLATATSQRVTDLESRQ